MGADSFHVFYGIRWEIDAANEDSITRLEQRQDSRQLAAKKHELESWWGTTTDQNCYFLLIGKCIGTFGWEGEHSVELLDTESSLVVEETKRKLLVAELQGTPAWHFQFEPDY